MTLMKLKGQATIEDLLRCPKDGRKYELVDGEILVSPAGARHAEIASKISHILATFLEKSPLGKVYGDNLGISFPNGNLRSPDVTFVRSGKLPGGKSPDSFGEFLECGVPLVWLVDPKHETVTVYRSLSDTEQYSAQDIITAEPALPGFSCPVSQFFD